MYKLMIVGNGPKGQGRSFIVAREDVLKGGKERVHNVGKDKVVDVELIPGRGIYEVTNKCGKFLETFADVNVLEKDGKEVIRDESPALTAEERIAQLEEQIKEMKSKKRAKKIKETVAP